MENIVNGFFYAISVVGELYENSVLSSFFQSSFLDSQKVYSSYLTDTVTLFAALAAIAIPIAQQTLQWASDKYQSPSLVTFIDFTATIKPREMNKKLLFYICEVLVFKVVDGFIDFNQFIFLLILLYILIKFFYLIRCVIQHFEHTYKVVQGLDWVKESIGIDFIDEHLKIKDKNFLLKIKVLSEYESFHLINDPQYIEMSKSYREIGYKFTKELNKPLNHEAVTCFLSGLDYICYSLLENKNSHKYMQVAHYYSYIVSKCIKSTEAVVYTNWLSSLYYLASSIETNLKATYKPISSGRVFLNISWVGKWNEEAQNALIIHFRDLVNLNIKNNDIENIINLFESANQVINFHERKESFEWFIQTEIQELFTSEHAANFRQLIVENIDKQDGVQIIVKEIPTTKQLIIDELKEPDIELVNVLEETFRDFEEKLLLFRFKTLLESEVLNLIALSAKLEPSIIVRCREKQNSINAEEISLNSTLIPSSLKEVFLPYFTQERFMGWDRMSNWSLYLSKGLSILFIYEIIKNFKSGDEKGDYSFISEMSIDKLDKSVNLLNKMKGIIPNCMVNPAIQELLILHACSTDDIESRCILYIDELSNRISDLLKRKLTTDPMSNLILERFNSSFYEGAERVLKNSALLKKLTLVPNSGHIYNVRAPRRAFLDNSGAYYEFGGNSKVVDRHLRQVTNAILNDKAKSLDANACTPYSNGRLIIIGRSGLNLLIERGFVRDTKTLVWPDSIFSCPIECVNSDSTNFVLVNDNESLVKVNFEGTNLDKLPIKLEFDDQGSEIIWKISINISPKI